MILGKDGPVVVLSAKTCAWLEQFAHLSRLRVDVRGTNPHISQELEEIRSAAMAWACSQPVREQKAPSRELAPPSKWLTTRQAADLLGIGPRGVQQAIARGLLPAERDGRGFRISREDLKQYRSTRAA